MEATDTVLAPALPNDVLEDILRRLPARSLAASRRICKAWRDVVDERQLLLRLRRLLPHSVHGLFVNYLDHRRPHFLARPAPAQPADGGGGGPPGNDAMYVCNTTRRCVRLPPHHDYRHQPRSVQRRTFLVFDPAASPAQWEVLMAPLEPHKEGMDTEPEERMMEWPPATWRWSVLSSTTMEWEEKVFVREGEAAGTVAELLMHDLDDKYQPRWRYGAYCQGALYVHCRGEFISRLSLSTTTYRVIKSPIDLAESRVDEGAWLMSYIGRSGNRVCFAAVDESQLRVWILNESGDQTEWLLKHRSVLNLRYEETRGGRPWTLDAFNKYGYDIETEDETEDDEEVSHEDTETEEDGEVSQEDSKTGDGEEISLQDCDTSETEDDEKVSHEDSKTEDDEKVSEEDNRDWNSDDDSITDIDEEEDNFYFQSDVDFLGFHPYREVIFLGLGNSAVAYHLNSTKAQYLGDLNPRCYNRGLIDSFVYTPCLIGV
ncbi:unnamed protein product [Urochloa decumbens]|uniref:F-box domain-containing protein n=1 Tax=Urochloa decumbens TaxID=240449 RepID=A0ABC9HAN5_9POAL